MDSEHCPNKRNNIGQAQFLQFTKKQEMNKGQAQVQFFFGKNMYKPLAFFPSSKKPCNLITCEKKKNQF